MARGTSILKTFYLVNRTKQTLGKAKAGVGSGVGAVRKVASFAKRGRENLIGFEERNARRIDKRARELEIKKIQEHLERAMGIRFAKLRRVDPRIKRMARIIHDIFGKNITAEEIKIINPILQMGLSKNSLVLKNSKALNESVKKINAGKGNDRHFAILRQASFDLIAQDEMGRKILEAKGLI
jgi:hypothetical protein